MEVKDLDIRRIAHGAALVMRAYDARDAQLLEQRLRDLLFECEARLHELRGGTIHAER